MSGYDNAFLESISVRLRERLRARAPEAMAKFDVLLRDEPEIAEGIDTIIASAYLAAVVDTRDDPEFVDALMREIAERLP